MKKIICSLVLSLAVCLSFFSVFTFALNATENNNYVVDDCEFLTEKEEQQLEALLGQYSKKHSASIVVVTASTLGEKSAVAYGDDFFDDNGYGEDGILLLISTSTSEWYISTSGICIDIFSDDVINTIADDVVPYISDGDYYEGFVVFGGYCNEYFNDYNGQNGNNTEGITDFYDTDIDFVVDEDDLLTDEEEIQLQALLCEYSKAHGVNIVVLTAETLGGKTAEAYADDYFDYNGYGEDGILFLICMESRDWHFSTKGICIKAFTDDGLDALADDVLPYIKSGECYKAFSGFGADCNDYLINYENGRNYDGSDPEGYKKSLIFIDLILGFGLAFIPMGIFKKQLKTVEEKRDAQGYAVDGSININQRRDTFIYKNVTRTAKPKETSSSGGSSTHTSSSGSTHGGRGGKF